MNAQELKAKLSEQDIIKIITTLGSDLIRQTDEYILFTTYACHGGSSPKLYYYPNSKYFHCYSECGQIDIISIVCENKGYDIHEGIQYICNLVGISNLKYGFNNESIEIISDWQFINSFKRNRQQKVPLKSDFYDESILNIFQDIYTSEWRDDGISNAVMKEFEIKYSTLKQSIIIPHRDINGGLMGVRQRNLLEDSIEEFGKYCPFYIHRQMFNHPLSQNLYGIHKNKECVSRLKKVMLVESEKGVLQAATMFGKNNNFTLSICGNKVSTFQRNLLISLGVEEVIIALDRQYVEMESDEYYKWIEHLQKHVLQILLPYFKVNVIWDTEGLLSYKSSSTDFGKEILLKLMKQKIYVST